ncbi:beta-galactosidase [Maribellus comscasis]|uniref:beta-galactosidase n=1 Tax=Maribellus comscasis TaxID=2681766 RepID=A0A6I6JSS0_9BACT|nr:sugar-binding domain-containing protein [Maribellus comscasis]QGY44279.1 beta-galactosidase [Maribellus comscasis]
MRLAQIFLILTLVFALFSCSENPIETIDLSGEWQFQMDPDDRGERENWFEKDFSETVQLPGSMVENGKGYDVALKTKWTGSILQPDWFQDPNYAPYEDSLDIKFPFWLQPEKKYTGAAWYNKKITIPENWIERTVFLNLERVHWQSAIWINSKKVDKQNSLATPHIYNISSFLKTGENVISICIDNRTKDIDVGENSHSISDHTQSNWNGIVGNVSLQSKRKTYIENIEVYPDIHKKTATIKLNVFNASVENLSVKAFVSARLKNTGQNIEKKIFDFGIVPGQNILKMIFDLGEDAQLWDEFHPNVYELTVSLKNKQLLDKKTVDFGLREFGNNGRRFEINGRPVFLRGTLECAIFPKTGYPPTRIAPWEKVFTAVKNHGLNHVRFHSWCPPEAAFEAADKMGIYLQVECSSWANQSTQLGSGFPVDDFIWEESRHIVQEYGNHPSFVMMAYGNEPGGPRYSEFLSEFVNYWKGKDDRRVYTGASGWPALQENDFHVLPQPRIQGWGEELNSIINSQRPSTDFDWSDRLPDDGIPVVSHEIGQWCVYPNFKEIEKYSGVLKPKNFELFRESLNAHHMGELADSFLLASGKLQALCYKADIEAALRTPGFAGFQLLDLHDFPGQGTALVGILDPFWEEKGYISPEEYRRFCNTTVPLARLEKRIFTEGEILNATIEVAHFGEQAFENINPLWELKEKENTIAEGTLGGQKIPLGNTTQLGQVQVQFQKENRPRKLTLEVTIGDFVNSWGIWVYPENNSAQNESVKVVEKLDKTTVQYLKDGGKVLLSLGQGKTTPDMGGNIGVGFSSIFWNTAWTNNQKPHTLGILCNPEHPALELFPTEFYSSWQWQDAMSHADAIQLDSFPKDLKPIVRIVDNWVTNRRLALIFETKVGEGSLLISGADIVNNLENRPEARQLRISLLNYTKSDKFNPAIQLPEKQIKAILK